MGVYQYIELKWGYATMSSVFDVAQYILESTESMTTIKLEKLVYYAQAWHLVWEDTPLFDSRIEAWANGPVCPDLYDKHRGMFFIDKEINIGNPDNLAENEIETIQAVLDAYGKKSAEYLVTLTHMEQPWKDARKRAGVLPGERCNEEITLADMAEYYIGIVDV